MIKRILAAVAVTVLSCAVYRMADQMATAERGYKAFGGEELLFILGIVLALCIAGGAFSRGKKKGGSRKTTASQTESKQSESNSP